MDNQIELNDYKQNLADIYSRRSSSYDESAWHSRIAQQLVKYAQIIPGNHVLDIATGTGHLAIASAEIVGLSGKIVGVDISPGMLAQAKYKVKELNLTNIEFLLADGEALNFPKHSFDRILCANAFPLMEDRLGALQLWYQLLKPGGIVGIHTPVDTGFTTNIVLEKIFNKYGVLLDSSRSIGTVEKCHDLLIQAKFTAIEIKTEQHGNYISLEQAQQRWNLNSFPIPGKSTSSLSQLSSIELEQMKTEFAAELATLATEKGIWNNGTSLFAYGRK